MGGERPAILRAKVCPRGRGTMIAFGAVPSTDPIFPRVVGDFLATRPVIYDPIHFDSADEEQDLFGAWATYKAIEGQTYDLFALQYNNESGANDFQYTTLGGRWLGSADVGFASALV